MDEQVIRRAEGHLADYGFDLAVAGEMEGFAGEQVWDAALTRRDDPSWRWDVAVVVLDPLTISSLRGARRLRSIPRPYFLIGRRVTERSAAELRGLDVAFIDAGGNAFVRHDGVLLDVRGRAAGLQVTPSQARRSGVNLFSTRRSQVLFALLSWPETWNLPRRTVARIAGVSVGLVSEVMDGLESSEVQPEDLGPGARVRDVLIDQWVAAFPTGLGALRRARTFLASNLEVRAVPGVEMYLGGESAAAWLRPEALSLWVRPWRPELALENRWRSGSTSNVTVREVFWTAPRPTPGVRRNAPPLLVYAELVALDDSRSREAADRLRAETGLVDGF